MQHLDRVAEIKPLEINAERESLLFYYQYFLLLHNLLDQWAFPTVVRG